MTNRTCAMRSNDSTPDRRLVAAGIKRTGQPWLIEQPQQSAADQAAHAAASHVRRPAMTS
ncbi:hypothetical protein OG435_15310 [Streptomyces sp. NBC_01264]|nr:hypothetical protein [Streptomyces sp. NBC_01264]